MQQFKGVPFTAVAQPIAKRTKSHVWPVPQISAAIQGPCLYTFSQNLHKQFGQLLGVSTWAYIINLDTAVLILHTPTHILHIGPVLTVGAMHNTISPINVALPNYTNKRNPAAKLSIAN